VPSEDNPYFPPVKPDIVQKQWTTSHLDSALDQVPPPTPPAEPAPAPPQED
jgi:hypothetical protein